MCWAGWIPAIGRGYTEGNDYKEPEEIIAAGLAKAEAGSFISLHLGENTLTALDTLLQELAAQDLGFCTVSENLLGVQADAGQPEAEEPAK